MTNPDKQNAMEHPTYIKLLDIASARGITSRAEIGRMITMQGYNCSSQALDHWKKRGVPARAAMFAAKAFGVTVQQLLGDEPDFTVTYEIDDKVETELMEIFSRLREEQKERIRKEIIEEDIRNRETLAELLMSYGPVISNDPAKQRNLKIAEILAAQPAPNERVGKFIPSAPDKQKSS